MKTCAKCNKEKKIVEFYKQRFSKDGFQSACIACTRVSQSDYHKKWYKENKELKLLSNAEWFAKNPGKMKEYQQSYWKSNPEKLNLKGQRRRALKLGGGVYYIKVKEVSDMLKRPCSYCDKESKHIDHIIPLSRGGRHSIGNLTQACASCNILKSNKLLIEWRTSYGFRR